MKTRFATRFFHGNFFLLALLSGLSATTSRADTNFTAGSFVEALSGFVSVASGVNSADGTTYLVGRNDSNQAILKKYDSSGAQLTWEGTNVVDLVINGITPSSVVVASGTTNFYIAGGSKILRLSTKTGQVIATADAANNALKLQGLYFYNDTLYACGNLSGGATLFGKSAPARGSQAGVVIKFSSNLPTTAQSLITFGNTGGASINTADSIVVDDSGDIYVSGHLDVGEFASSVFTNGWAQFVKYSSSVVDLTTASNAFFTGTAPINLGTGTSVHIVPSDSEKSVSRATGVIYIPTTGSYTFINRTDDGSWLKIDGDTLVYDNTAHGEVDFSKTVSLFAGYHYVDFLAFSRR